MKPLKAYLILSCNGYVKLDGFIFCGGVSNPIIDLEDTKSDNYQHMIDFMDNTANLFSYRISDYNECVNIISYLYNQYNAYDKNMYINIQKFLRDHKSCGINIYLILKEDYINE